MPTENLVYQLNGKKHTGTLAMTRYGRKVRCSVYGVPDLSTCKTSSEGKARDEVRRHLRDLGATGISICPSEIRSVSSPGIRT